MNFLDGFLFHSGRLFADFLHTVGWLCLALLFIGFFSWSEKK